MLQSACQFLKFDQIIQMKTWKETNLSNNLETHKKTQPVIETQALPKWAKFLHTSIKICEIYNSRMQFKSKPFHLPLSAVTLHHYRVISAAANKTKLYILYVQIKLINSNETK